MKALPERQRLALTLFHHEGLSQIEVGDVMGISDEAVESLLSGPAAASKRHWKVNGKVCLRAEQIEREVDARHD